MQLHEQDQTHDFFDESFPNQSPAQNYTVESTVVPQHPKEAVQQKAFPSEPLAGKKLTLSSIGGTLLFLYVIVGHFFGWDTSAVGITVGEAITGLMTSLGFLFADLRLRKMQKQNMTK